MKVSNMTGLRVLFSRGRYRKERIERLERIEWVAKKQKGKSMGIGFRNIELERDRVLLLKYHCRINYECECEHGRSNTFETYYSKWLTVESQVNEFLESLKQSLNDPRTLAVIVLNEEQIIGYLWMTFTDLIDYKITIAELQDIFIEEEYRGKGIGVLLMDYSENRASKNGACILRSGTGADNIKSIKMHEKSGFKPYRIEFEKRLN